MGPSSLPCLVSREEEESHHQPGGRGEGRGGRSGVQGGGRRGGKGGVVMRGSVWLLQERIFAGWKER